MKTYYYYYARIVIIFVSVAIIGPALAQSPITGPSFTATDYKKALWMTNRMYGGQRSGDKNTSNGNWLLFNHSLAPDGRTFLTDADNGYDLSGGWFDCGDHVKFGHTQYWSAYVLLKGFAEFAPGYDDRYAADNAGYKNANNYTFEGNGHVPNNIPDILDEAKHATDYIIKCTPDANNFYYQVGDGNADHMQWVTAAKMQGNPTSTGGEPRAIYKNPADGAMPSLAGAALALMSRLYRPYDAAYADLCLTHAKYAYSYANPRKTQTVGAPGGFYGTNSNPQNAYAILLTELYWASNDQAYKTEALAMTVDASSSSANVRGNSWGMDYANNGDLAVYNLYLLGKTGADAAFNTIVNTNYLGNVQSDGQFNGGNTTYGPLRYNAGGALIVALWTKRNSITAAAKTFIYSNIDYILGKNSKNYSFIVGFGSTGATHPHHRNVYMSDANNNANLTIPTKNQQHGYMVGGARNPNNYQDVTNTYQYTEGGIDYSCALVGALAWINIQVAPVNKYTVPDVVVTTPTVTLTAPSTGTTVCQGTAITLTATASDPSGTITKVEFYDGTTLITSVTSSPYTYSWTSAGVGSHSITAKATNGTGGTATSTASTVTVNVSPAAPGVTTPVTFCQGATATALTVTGTSLKWYTTATNGTASTTAPTPATTTAGTTSYYVSQTVNGCEGARATINVVINTLPSAPGIATPVTYCQGATATALTATGTSLKWYTTATNGTASTTAPTPVTTTAGTTSYYVSQTVNGCEGARATINVVINALPSAPGIATPVTYCQGATATALTATGTSLKWYTTATNGTASATAPTPVTATTGTTSYYVSQTVNGCEGARATINVVINALPSAPGIATPVTYCQGATATALTATGTSLKWYTTATNGTASATAPTPVTATAGTTSYYVSQTVNGCESQRAVIDVVVNPSPTATITANGSTTIPQGGSVVLNANTGTGLSYTWFNGLNQVGTNSTYTATVAGNYTVEVTTASGCKATSSVVTVTMLSNQLPSVTISAPFNNAVFTSPATITLTATATDPDGTITSVTFYNGSTVLGTVTTSPYTFTWSNVAAGQYSITAIATDNNGATAASTVVNMTVNDPPNQAPSISIVSPVNNASFIAPASVTISAVATDADGTISSVEFYNGNTLLGSATGSSPYSFTWSGIAAGIYSITAKATDNKGAQTTSAAVNITVTANQPSVITINSPVNNSTVGSSVTINVTATDPDGTITLVEYLDGGTVIGTSTTTPYTFTADALSAGTHVITVRVTDSNGGVTTSTPVTVTVNTATGITSSHNYGTFMDVYPNPSSETFRIKPNREIKQLRMLNVYGEMVAEMQNIIEGQQTEIGRNLKDGTYILIVEYASGIIEVAKLVKIK